MFFVSVDYSLCALRMASCKTSSRRSIAFHKTHISSEALVGNVLRNQGRQWSSLSGTSCSLDDLERVILGTQENSSLSGFEASWQWLIPAGSSEYRPHCWSLSLACLAPKQAVSCLLQEKKKSVLTTSLKSVSQENTWDEVVFSNQCWCWIQTFFWCFRKQRDAWD